MDFRPTDPMLASALAEIEIVAFSLSLAKLDMAYTSQHVENASHSCQEASRLLGLVPEAEPTREAIRSRVDALMAEIRTLKPEINPR